MRLDTVSLRGMYNQQIHGSKRSLRSVEDFTEFEQRSACFDGDHVIAERPGRLHAVPVAAEDAEKHRKRRTLPKDISQGRRFPLCTYTRHGNRLSCYDVAR